MAAAAASVASRSSPGTRPIVPAPIVQAILLCVGAWYENREETVIGVSVAALPEAVAVDRLIGAYKRVAL